MDLPDPVDLMKLNLDSKTDLIDCLKLDPRRRGMRRSKKEV